MDGFIKLHRKLLEWEWYSDEKVTRLFIHCLLKANYIDKKWQGIIIKRGSFITSYQKLSGETGLSVQSVRTCINKLKSTGELTGLSHTQYTIISINQYDDYQETNKQTNKRLTNDQQTTNKQLTTTKERKKDKKDKNIISKDIAEAKISRNKEIQDRNIKLISYFKEKLGSELDGTDNWKYCTHLYNKIKRQYPEKDAFKGVMVLIDAALSDPFHSNNATNFRYLFNNLQKIIKKVVENNNKNLIVKI